MSKAVKRLIKLPDAAAALMHKDDLSDDTAQLAQVSDPCPVRPVIGMALFFRPSCGIRDGPSSRGVHSLHLAWTLLETHFS
jgi:hypothetical protein